MRHCIAITAINEVSKKQNIDNEDKLIVACEFISSLDLDSKFKQYLIEKFTQK
ncbi:MAG: hypothetical protein J7L15_08350 [Clostridiales bacterium]|nr:hypothetical protein [Clostridiales bacterium]